MDNTCLLYTSHEILSYQKEQQEKLEKLQRFEENFRLLKEKLMQAEKILEEASHELSEIRKEYSKQLDEKIIEGLKELNFEDVDFSIRFDRRKNYTDNGYDAVEYEISTNPGESRKPLGQIVSGGELSRIMLAIKAILADKDQIDTLIFDEIDTGISGRTAQKVSEKMAVIGQHRQVLCITHLPQIAAMADTHFEIEKHVEGTETITQILSLIHILKLFNEAKRVEGPVVVHVLTEKGRGYGPASSPPERFHGTGPFDIQSGRPLTAKTAPTYTDHFSGAICSLAEKNKKVVAITAAMPDGTGLNRFRKKFPERFFDVGIAEEHAVTFAAGMRCV